MGSSIRYSLFLFFTNVTFASDICLMLSPAEQAALDQAQELAQRTTAPTGDLREMIRLDGIVFRDTQSWTIWLNGRPIKYGQQEKGLRILRVTPDLVELICTPSSGKPLHMRLMPNESAPVDSEVKTTKK